MSGNRPASGYSGITKLLHWSMFLLIAAQFGLGPTMVAMPSGETSSELYSLHKSLGLLVLLLALLRVTWRATTALPDWAKSLDKRERGYLHILERVLYLFITRHS